jgi:BlaI family transcriptional regulator, penicillinase repressor
MTSDPQNKLSRREREIMEIIYRLGQATANEVRDQLPDPPGYSTVRTHLSILEQKGHLSHQQDGPRYLFRPTVSREQIRNSALQNLLRNFFEDSREQLISALLDKRTAKLSDQELENLTLLIEEAKKKGQ